jgi:hypothetical protein
MSQKREDDMKQTPGNLEVDAKAAGVQAPDAIGIGAVVDGLSTGNQKVTTDIGTVTGDKIGLLIGAVIRNRTENDPAK